MTTKLSPTAQRTKGALIAYLGPRMAQDAAIPKLTPILDDINASNFGIMIPSIARRVRSAVRPLLAQDADVEDLTDLLDALEETREEEGEDETIEAEEAHGDPDNLVSDPFPEAHDSEHELVGKIKAMLEGHVPPEMLSKLDEMVGEREHSQNEHLEHLMEDERYDRRADDARRRLGRDETPEEMEEREEREDAEDARKRADDRKRRADDGYDRHRADDAREADDRKRRADDSRKRRAARDARRAEDARKRLGRDETMEEAMDRRRKHRAEDRRRAEDARRRAEDRKHADDRHRADDRRRAEDDPPDFPGKPETGGSMVSMTKDGVKRMVDDAVRHAKDEALATREAERFVRTWVGELTPERSMALDSADQVYRHALKMLGVPADKSWPTTALKALIGAQPRPTRDDARGAGLALDASPSGGSFGDRFKFTDRIVTE